MKYDFQKDGITQSLMSDFMTCPRKYENSIHYKIDLIPATVFGSFGHKYLECFYSKKDFNFEAYEFPKEVSLDDQEYMRNVGAILFEEYENYYSKEKIQPEIVFDVKLKDFRLKGKIDGIKNNFIFETKFKSQIVENKLQERLLLDWQTNFYMIAYLLKMNMYPKGVIYNVIRYPKRSIKGSMKTFCDSLQKEIHNKPEYFFLRFETLFNKELIDNFKVELYHKLKYMKDYYPWKNQCACDLYSGCQYVKLCAKGDTDGLKKREKMFEELEN